MTKFIDADDTGFLAGAKVGAFKGAVRGLNNQMYHSLDKYWSSSHLKYMYDNSPSHFQNKYIKKNEMKKDPSDAMTLGSLVHCLLLEPSSFAVDFAVIPDLNFRTNEGKAAYQEFLSKNPGKILITDELLVKANKMKSSAANYLQKLAVKRPDIGDLLEPGIKEAAFFWTCPFSQLNFKAKLDQSSSKHWCEVKTTRSANPDDFSKDMDNLNYDLSLYHYREGLKQVMGVEAPAYFIAIESDEPHVTQVYKVGGGCWETGHSKWLSSVSKLESGIKGDSWDGYFPDVGDIQEINPPKWALSKLQVIGQ